MQKIALLSAFFMMTLSPVWSFPTLLSAHDSGGALASETIAAPADAATLPVMVTVGMAAAVLDMTGNERRVRQYVSPADGGYLNWLGVYTRTPDALLDLSARYIGETPLQGTLHAMADRGLTTIDGELNASRFFRDASDAGMPLTRKDGSAQWKSPLGSGEMRLFFDTVSLAEQGAEPGESWRRSRPGASYFTEFGNGMLAGLDYALESLDFRAGNRFSGQTQTLNFTYSPLRDARTSLQADAALQQSWFDTQTGKQAGHQLSLRGTHLLNADLALTGELSQQEITDTIIRNAYARRDRGAEFALEYSGLPRVNLELGGGRHRFDYVNGNQTLLIPVDQDTLFLRGAARITPQLRLRVLQQWQNTRNEPAAFDSLGMPYNTLYWTNRSESRGELSYAPAQPFGATGRLRYLTWDNGQMNTDNNLLEGSVYAWWMPQPLLTLYANYLMQDFALALQETNSSAFVTDNDTFVLGGSYQIAPGLLAELVLTDTNGRGAVDVDERQLWLGASYTFTERATIRLRTSFGDFTSTEDAPRLNNSHRWVELSLTNLIY